MPRHLALIQTGIMPLPAPRPLGPTHRPYLHSARQCCSRTPWQDLVLHGSEQVLPALPSQPLSLPQPGDLVVIPRGITHYTAQSNCEDTSALVMWNSASVTRVYPVQGLMDLPEGVLIGVLCGCGWVGGWGFA